MKIRVEDDVMQIWRKMRKKPDLECFITPIPAYYPKMLTLAFLFNFYENWRGGQSRAEK